MREKLRNAFFSIAIIITGITIPVAYHSQEQGNKGNVKTT